jgi:aminopeptidase
MEPIETPCAEWEDALTAMHPDDLLPAVRAALAHHLNECPACVATLATYRQMDQLIHQAFRLPCPVKLRTDLLPERVPEAAPFSTAAPVPLSRRPHPLEEALGRSAWPSSLPTARPGVSNRGYSNGSPEVLESLFARYYASHRQTAPDLAFERSPLRPEWVLEAEGSIDPSALPFEARLDRGAENVVRCMGVTLHDRVFIITDFEREHLARRVARAALSWHADVTVRFLEHYGERPLTLFSEELRTDLVQAQPTVSLYIATAKPGEITFRLPLLPFLVNELHVRHGHLIGLDDQTMAEGMCADYDEVFSLTHQVYDLVRLAQTIHVTSEKGSNITATFRRDWKWIPCHGRYTKDGTWGNLPEGEVFTAPAKVDGILVCDLLGDFFAAKYGVLKHPVTLTIQDSHVIRVASEDAALAQEVREYLFSTPNGNRVGEFGIGTLTGLKRLSGNLLQDEKMPGLHLAFGNPYPEFTGADWHAKIHVDAIPSKCTISVDGMVIMRDGEFIV